NYDTNLYRSAVATLKTDGNFRATGTISGSVVRADRLLASSGTLVTESGATFDGGTLYVDAAGNRVGVGVTTPKATLDVFGTISGKTLVVSGNGSFSGALVVKKSISGATLEILGTASGADLYATRSITGTNIYAASTFDGAGLADCDAAGQTLNWDATTKRFICGVDDSAGSGLDLGTGDARYVRKSGDTMTGALIINITGGNNATLGLRVLNTISGSIIHAEKTLSSSGNLVVHQFANGTGALINSDAIGSPVLALDGQRSGTYAALAPHILFGYRGYFDTRLYRMTGSVLMTNASLLPETTNMYDLGSNTFRWRDLYLSGGTIDMGQNGDNGKIRYNTTTDTFNVDAGGDGNNELSILATGRVGVGTTTPTNMLDITTGDTLNSAFHIGEILNKGAYLTSIADGQFSLSTGAEFVAGSTVARHTAASVIQNSDGVLSFLTDTGLTVGNTFTPTERMRISADGKVGIGTTNPTSALEVQGNISGSTLQILGTASGQNLFATRSISGTYLYAATTFGGAGLASCSNATTSKLLYNSATKQFSCGTDQTGGTGVAGTSSFSGAVLRLSDARYVKKSGDTMTGALVISVTGGTRDTLGLRIINTASGAHLHAEQLLTSSGTLIVAGNGTVKGTLSGKTLVVSGNASVTGSLVVKKSISGATLEILGTASGADLYATRSITGTNIYAATTFGGAGLADC
ncbi:MAG TPA: polymer-forming cytoskeletal protein, partial [Candidatus Peribacteria bacterium]|nr:polymer-forming cytoskeletal protein [Candidatus Peribacteria bacterium]